MEVRDAVWKAEVGLKDIPLISPVTCSKKQGIVGKQTRRNLSPLVGSVGRHFEKSSQLSIQNEKTENN